MTFKLKEYTTKVGISLSRLSRVSGVPRVSLSRYAHGVQSPTLDQFSKIVSALGCEMTDLVDDSDEWSVIVRNVMRRFNPDEDKSWVGRLAFLLPRQYSHVKKI